MRHRYLSTALALALIGGLTAGCGSDSAGSANEINLIMSNHPWQRAIEPLIDEFEQESGVTVKVQTFAEQQMRDKVQLNLQSRSSSMDVFMTLPSREGPQFAKANYYEPLDERASGAADYQVDDFPEAVRAGMTVDDKMIAAPINVEGVVLYYRTDLFEQYGVKPPTSLDELTTAAEQIKQKSGGKVTPIALRGQSAALPFTFGPFLHSEGVAWTKPDGKPNFDDPKAIAAIDRYATLAREYGPPGVVNNTFTQSSALFAAGNAAMELESSNELSSIVDPKTSKVAENIGVLDFPAGSAGSKTTVLSWGLAVSSFSKNKDAAWKFVQWATSAETQLELTKSGIAPPRTSVTEDPAYTATLNTETLKQWNTALTKAQSTGETEVGPVGVAAAEMRKVIGDAVGKVILGRASAEDAAKEIQDGLTPLLAKNTE
ncbi:carbohydrate ABC transporter substrate-binding protein, CUT1 family [Micromonospora pallida]|uniref:Carbohydrate ABC transporter substrate-binding protein, CUT1 family n=1 Tax=Micromonospora pallida TaxID=145854 RepID=A0A1C6STF3_9ACTN|nr:sugar ABC transporter substrate-binding protein [Micromonospora pallida]SCL32435.1 carbohydrate ABC transporter substrate-binding protein, CUT1 family [Micromonospora pallida]